METPKENRMKGSERTEEGRASLLTLKSFLFFRVGKLNAGCASRLHITDGGKIFAVAMHSCVHTYTNVRFEVAAASSVREVTKSLVEIYRLM